MNRPETLRGRIALAATAVTGAWVVALTVGFNLVLGAQLHQQADSVLRTRAEAVATVPVAAPCARMWPAPRSDHGPEHDAGPLEQHVRDRPDGHQEGGLDLTEIPRGQEPGRYVEDQLDRCGSAVVLVADQHAAPT